MHSTVSRRPFNPLFPSLLSSKVVHAIAQRLSLPRPLTHVAVVPQCTSEEGVGGVSDPVGLQVAHRDLPSTGRPRRSMRAGGREGGREGRHREIEYDGSMLCIDAEAEVRGRRRRRGGRGAMKQHLLKQWRCVGLHHALRSANMRRQPVWLHKATATDLKKLPQTSSRLLEKLLLYALSPPLFPSSPAPHMCVSGERQPLVQPEVGLSAALHGGAARRKLPAQRLGGKEAAAATAAAATGHRNESPIMSGTEA